MEKKYVRSLTSQDRIAHFQRASLHMLLTERCNNNCIHCAINQPEDSPELKAREMDTALVKNILDQAAQQGFFDVRFTGGEPLLREDFEEIYTYARRKGLRVIIFTNARLITPELIQLLKKLPPGKILEVTVYGMHPESYEAVTATRGSFKDFWRGVQLLIENKIPFIVKQSLLPPNKHEIEEFEAFAASLPNRTPTPSYAYNFELRTRRDDPAKNARIRRLRISPEETVAMLKRIENTFFDDMRLMASGLFHPPGNKIFSCGAGMNNIAVDAYGYVKMCLGLQHPDTIYPLDPALHRNNHPETDLSPLEYAMKKVFKEVLERRSTNPEYLRRCAVCFLKALCSQCPAKSWQEHGTLDTPIEYFCEITHAKAVYAGLLREGEKTWELPPKEWKARVAALIHSPS
jgi:radical SAM protein with 4Fe4S-binding SPASM domain